MRALGGYFLVLMAISPLRASEPAARSDAEPVRLLDPVSVPPPVEASAGDSLSLRVIEVYQEGGSTKLIIQSRQPLVTGRSLYIGPQEAAVTIGPVFSRGGGLLYYFASAPGKIAVGVGDPVRLGQKRRVSLPESVLRAMRASYGFEQKSVAEITAVQGDRAMIDKGTMHEVHERDLFRIYDATGSLKGLLEVRGIGDLQSSGKLDARDTALLAEPGDYAVFLGQRRLFGLGIMGGMRLQRTQVLHAYDRSSGGGLLWSVTFYNGWGLEALFGYYIRESHDTSSENAFTISPLTRQEVVDERSARYMVPIWLKKNFRYPSLISPFLGAGMYWFEGSHAHDVLFDFGRYTTGRETKIKRGFYPVMGAGIEFFPARFFRPRIEVRRFYGPDLTARGNIFHTNSTYYSIGVLTSW